MKRCTVVLWILLIGNLQLISSQNANVLNWCPSAALSDSRTMGPATIHGNRFFDSATGQYHPVIGINYYPRPNSGPLIANNIDFFTEDFRHIWERDLIEFQRLGINTIRLFAVDGSKNHDAFVCALRNLGIRLIIGLSASCQDCAITLTAAPSCYPAALKRRGQQIVAEFSRYDNVLAFSVSNEIGLQLLGTPEVNAPCAKQFIKDMRMFMASCGGRMRQVPVGLAVADRDRQENALYYLCEEGSDEDDGASMSTAEWYGINAYQHCNANSDTIRGFERLKGDFQQFNLTVPVVLTEFGCINPSFPEVDGYEAQRDFRQIPVLFSEDYSQHFAGGCVFEYSNEDRKTPSPWPYREYYRQGNFGVGYYGPRLCDDIDVPCVYIPFPQFDVLAAAYNDIDVSYVSELGSQNTPSVGEIPECPSQFPRLDSFVWPSDSIDDWPCPAQPIPVDPVVIEPPVDVLPVRSTASCSAHSRCSSLAGDCCPTTTGLSLSCCESQPIQTCQQNPLCEAVGEEACCPTESGLYLDCCSVIPTECDGGMACIAYSTEQYIKDLSVTSIPPEPTSPPITARPTTAPTELATSTPTGVPTGKPFPATLRPSSIAIGLPFDTETPSLRPTPLSRTEQPTPQPKTVTGPSPSHQPTTPSGPKLVELTREPTAPFIVQSETEAPSSPMSSQITAVPTSSAPPPPAVLPEDDAVPGNGSFTFPPSVSSASQRLQRIATWHLLVGSAWGFLVIIM